jgi:oligopeptide/dipeptide ABC transporter ATP-binding protein
VRQRRADDLLVVDELVRHIPVREGVLRRSTAIVRAVDGVSFRIRRGETLALVGESGCGKTTVGRCVLRLDPATAGRVIVEGDDLLALDRRRLRDKRRTMQMVFQDPFASLDPRQTVESIVAEGLLIHRVAGGAGVRPKVVEALARVGIGAEALHRYPHEFSGGQRQRIALARALAVGPSFLVLDEVLSSLDVSVQAQVINLLVDLQKELGLTYLLISHDLSVVRHVSHRVAVMYAGQIVEESDSEALFAGAKHPYTQALLAAVPTIRQERTSRREVLRGEVPSPLAPPAGCRFHPRCPHAEDRCRVDAPPRRFPAADHRYDCIL